MTTATRTLTRLSKSVVGEAEAAALAEVIRDGRLGMGSFVALFEQDLSRYIGGNRHVVCVNTGTAALHLALQACGIGAGDEVLVPTITYLASFQAISATGATPVACDVREADCSLDVADAARRLTHRTRAIMPVHYASGPGSLAETYEFAFRHGLRVVEDAAHAFGCRSDGGERVGARGDVVCFSFDGIKNITCGEGGAVVTGDETVAQAIRDGRLLGVENDTEKRLAGTRSWEFDVHHQGWRYHMSNLNAAIGRVQLGRFENEFAPKRVALARRYRALLSSCAPALRTLAIDYGPAVPHIFPVVIEDGRRDAVRKALLADGVECGIHYKPNHLLSLYGGGSVNLPAAEALYDKLLTLPLHPDLSNEDVEHVAAIVTSTLAESR